MRFYRSPAFRLALVYLVMCAVAIGFGADLSYSLRAAWSWWRPRPCPATFVSPEDQALANAALHEFWRATFWVERLAEGCRATLYATPFLAALGALARVLARARVRAGEVDPLARVRVFAKKHAALTVASPAMLWLAYSAAHYVRHDHIYRLPFAVAAPLVFLVQLLVTRFALAALLAPTLDTNDEAKDLALAADDFDFAAVAVTREAKLKVKGLVVLTVAMVASLLAVPTFDNIVLDVGVALYVPLALSLAIYFRRASRISVGLDGIHIRGSSRSRFYAFSDLDDARTNGSTIEILRAGRETLRLQLHGPDAARRDALVHRLSAALARAADERDAPVTRFVNNATRDALARVADGSVSYREAAVSRDQLWAALEGPSVAPVARVAAAEVLARNPDPSERARFRIAAERCAEPSARARMHELLEDEEEQSDGAAGLVASSGARRLVS